MSLPYDWTKHLSSLGLFCLMLVSSEQAPAQDPRPLTVVGEWQLPHEVSLVSNLRWGGPDSFLIPSKGALALVQTPDSARAAEIETRIPARELGRISGVASSELYRIVSNSRELSWKTAGDPDFSRFHHFGFVMDFDLNRDKILVLGARIDPEIGTISEGALAWTGSLDDALQAFRPVLYSKDSHDEEIGAMGKCGYLGLGAVRFLADGSFAVAPGVEPNVFLYHPDGRLHRVLGTDELGIDTGCHFDVVERKRVRTSMEYRFESLFNKYRLLDDILPLAGGPALVVRSFSAGMTRWRMILIEPDGRSRSIPLPFTSPSPYSVLEGDVRDDRIVFLVQHPLVSGKQPAPAKIILTTAPGSR